MWGRASNVWLPICGLAAALSLAPPGFEAAYAADPAPKIEVLSLFVAEPGSATDIAVRLHPPEQVPKNAYLRIRGLPASATLSDGHSVNPGVWSVPLMALPALKVMVPKGVSGRSEISLSLMSVEGDVLAEARSALVVAQVNLRAPEAKPAPKEVLVRPDAPIRAEMVPSTPQAAPQPAAPPPQAAAPAPQLPPPTPPAPTPATKPHAALTSPPASLSAPAPAQPQLSAEARQRSDRLVEQGDAAFEGGKITIARQFYLRAAESGFGRAALRLARTYDPAELQRLKVQGLVGDVAEARRWYERARDLGEAEAAARLRRLPQ